jgi:hypothetical protein
MKLLPIESAPKDGTEVFIYNERYPCMIKAKFRYIEDDVQFHSAWEFDGDIIRIGEEEGILGWAEDVEAGLMPTHYMPIPSKEELG